MSREGDRKKWLNRVLYTKALLGLFEVMEDDWRSILARELLAEGDEGSQHGAIVLELAEWIEEYAA